MRPTDQQQSYVLKFIQTNDAQATSWHNFLLRNGATAKDSIIEAEMQWLRSLGATGQTVTDLWASYLGMNNYHSGNLDDDLRNFLANGTLSLTGMYLWLRNNTGIYTDGAAKFVSTNLDYLYTAYNSSWSTNGSFEITGWVTPRSIGTYQIIAGQYNPSTGPRAWVIRIKPDGKLEFVTYTAANGFVYATSSQTLVVGTKYFFAAAYISTSKLMRIKVNGTVGTDGTRVDAPDTGTGNITFGVQGNLTTYWSDIELDSLSFATNVTAIADGNVYNALYNSGNGRTFSQLTVANGLDFFKGRQSHWYDFNESSGIRYDKKGTSNLTASIGAGGSGSGPVGIAGIASGVPGSGETVSSWVDTANSITFAQPTYTKRPAYYSGPIYGRPGIVFDGVNDQAVASGTDFIGTGDKTFYFVIAPLGAGANSQGTIISNGKFQVRVSSVNNKLVVSSDQTTWALAAPNSLTYGAGYVVAVTRSSAGVVNIYMNGVLNGAANQSSGTPVAGGSVYLGNTAAGNATWNGTIGDTVYYNNEVQNQTQITTATNYLKGLYGIS